MFDTLKKDLPGYISEKRFAHVCRVADAAVLLADIHQVDKQKAALAGISHDIAKELTPGSIQQYGLTPQNNLQELYNEHPAIWHAFVGPALLTEQYQIEDNEILSAIKWHTTGADQLSLLDQIIYVADFIEPGRKHPFVNLILELAKQNMDEATFATAACSIRSLKDRGRKIHPYTQSCYDAYAKRIGHERQTTIESELDHVSATT